MAITGIGGVEIAGFSGPQLWTAQNKFLNSNLSAIGFDSEGMVKHTEGFVATGATSSTISYEYPSGASSQVDHPYPYTSYNYRITGPTVVITNTVNEIIGGSGAGLGVSGNIIGDTVYGAVWNDLADCISVPDDTNLVPGYCYCFDGINYYKSEKYLPEGIIGIHSDTYGFAMGKEEGKTKMNVAVAGYVLAYVDQEYKSGTPLTATADGKLTELKKEDINKNIHKLVGYYWKPEKEEFWGPKGQEVQVNNRSWVKVR